jgi:hypothetical protein
MKKCAATASSLLLQRPCAVDVRGRVHGTPDSRPWSRIAFGRGVADLFAEERGCENGREQADQITD